MPLSEGQVGYCVRNKRFRTFPKVGPEEQRHLPWHSSRPAKYPYSICLTAGLVSHQRDCGPALIMLILRFAARLTPWPMVLSDIDDGAGSASGCGL